MKIYSSNSNWNSNSKQQFDYLWNTEYLSNVFGTHCAQHSWRRLEKCLTVKALRLLRSGRTELVEVKCNRTVKLLVNHYQYCSVIIVYSNKTRTHYQRMCFPLTTISGPLNEAWKSISLRRHSVFENCSYSHWQWWPPLLNFAWAFHQADLLDITLFI